MIARILRTIASFILPKNLLYFPRVFRDLLQRVKILEKNVIELCQLRISSQSIPDKMTICSDHELKMYSQNGEDGILMYIFSRIGTAKRMFVEFGIEDGRECNSRNLAKNFGWHGILMDGDRRAVEFAKWYYFNVLEISPSQVRILNHSVTAENIDQILLSNDVRGEIDLLSIDIDGNDYWVWRAISAVDPRVVVIEYNASFGPERSLTVKYDPEFERYRKHPSGLYHGASLVALTKLADSRDYSLVACESNGVNAFFVRRDVARGKLNEVDVKSAYRPQAYRIRKGTPEQQYEMIKNLDYEEV